MVSTERFSSPLEFDGIVNTYFSTSDRDQVFRAHTDALSVCYNGFSFCHPPHDDEVMPKLLRHADTPSSKPPSQLPPSCFCPTGEVSAATPTGVGLTITQILQKCSPNSLLETFNSRHPSTGSMPYLIPPCLLILCNS
eukprot:386794-Pelagomonas_calceolata.AAC.1